MSVIRCIAVAAMILAATALTAPPPATAEDNEVITRGGLTWIVASDRAREKMAQLERLIAEHSLMERGWIHTRVINVAWGQIPHSHPILTMNTRSMDNDRATLDTFLHENLHWYLAEEKETETEAAIAALAELYPDVPVGREAGGARSADSTRLHLIVNTMTYHRMKDLLGEAEAMASVTTNLVYPWVAEQVADPAARAAIEAVMRENGVE